MDLNRVKFFQCFQPIIIPLFATGCLSFRLNAKQQLEVSTFTKLYTNLARLVAIGCSIAGWIIKAYSKQFSKRLKELSPLVQFLTCLDLLISVTTYIQVTGILDAKKHIHIELYKRAYEIDKSLINEFSVNFNYEKTIRKNRIYMTILILYCVIYYIIYFINLDPDWRVALFAFGYTACTLGPGCGSFAHITAIDYLRIRFRLIHKMFEKYFRLNMKQEEMQRQRILSLINHYQRYYELIQGVNHIYGHIAIGNYFHDFTQTSSIVFALCFKASESKAPASEYIFICMFVLPRIVKVIYSAVYSHSTMKESKACSHIIATYDDRFPTKKIKKHIDAFLLWKKHNCFQFTVGKSLKSNYGLVYLFFQGIGNYVLILIQLKLQEISIEERLKDKPQVEVLTKIK